MEDLLRRSKLYPTFHWPREFMEPMKAMRDELKTKVDEHTHYIRIRPVQSEGKWRIRADIKPKEGEGKFAHAATWDVPPMDEAIRKKNPDWHVPTWAEVVRGRKSAGNPPPPRGGGWCRGG
jgi:hypothetical protein